jgi:hypothetical protein
VLFAVLFFAARAVLAGAFAMQDSSEADASSTRIGGI